MTTSAISAQLLLAQDLRHFPVEPLRLCHKNYNVHFSTYDNFAKTTGALLEDLLKLSTGEDGMTLKLGEKIVVLYNDKKNGQRLNFTLGHELGHIYLNHTVDNSAEETEADLFAADLLMPMILVKEVVNRFLHRPEKLDYVAAQIFNVSISAMRRRISELKDGERVFSEDEKLLLEAYISFIPYPDKPLIEV